MLTLTLTLTLTPYQVLSYGGLVLATALGVALHPQRATILDSLSQVSWT